jgi:hypothetical protein
MLHTVAPTSRYWKHTCVPREMIWTKFLVKNSRSFDWDSPNSRTVSRELLQGSRSTAAIMASSVAGVTEYVGDLQSQVSYVLHILSNQDAATVVETHPRLDDVDCNNVRTPVRQ